MAERIKYILGLICIAVMAGNAFGATQTVVVAEKTIALTDGSGETLTAGQLVCISGVNTVTIADADDSAKIAIGICNSTDHTTAQVQLLGKVTKLKATGTIAAGNILYLSQTAGYATATAPSAPAERQIIGIALTNDLEGECSVLLIIDFAPKWQ